LTEDDDQDQSLDPVEAKTTGTTTQSAIDTTIRAKTVS
jgi:hypothetical protein